MSRSRVEPGLLDYKSGAFTFELIGLVNIQHKYKRYMSVSSQSNEQVRKGDNLIGACC